MTKNKESHSGSEVKEDIEINLELIEERRLVRQEVIIELKKDIDSFRAIGLISTNYVESMCKDIVVYLEKNEDRRGLVRCRFMNILEKNKIIDNDVKEDLEFIFDIRDALGHTMRMSLIIKKIIPIIEKMHITRLLKKNHPKWKEYEINQQVFLITEDMMDWLDMAFDKIIFEDYNNSR